MTTDTLADDIALEITETVTANLARSQEVRKKRSLGIVYNPYNLDSVITAAFLKFRVIMTDDVTVPHMVPTNLPFKTGLDSYYWVGVAENSRLSKGCGRSIEFNTVGATDEVSSAPRCLFFKALDHFKYQQSSHWQLSLLIDRFNKMDSTLSIEEQAVLYANWKEASCCVFGDRPFRVMDADIRGYMQNLDCLKGRLSSTLSFLAFDKGDRIEHVPYLNVSADAAPWVLKFLSIRFKNAVVYEVVCGNFIITTWSQDHADTPKLADLMKKKKKEVNVTSAFSNCCQH